MSDLKALYEKATARPWQALESRTVIGLYSRAPKHPRSGTSIARMACGPNGSRSDEGRNDAALIVHAVNSIEASEAEVARLREVLEWYGEQARLARLIHSEGDAGRHALADDGGKRARTALSPVGGVS
jgi:hypothetical protein